MHWQHMKCCNPVHWTHVEEFIITTPFLVEICIHIYWGRQGIFREKFELVFLKIVNCDFD